MKTAAYLAVGLVLAAIAIAAQALNAPTDPISFPSAMGQQAVLAYSSAPASESYLAEASPPDELVSSHLIRVAPWGSGPFSGPISNAPIPHFGVVAPGILYRSAQPSPENFRWLRSVGIRSIVSLRRETGEERDYVMSQGFANYLWLNIEDETDPNDAQAERFLDFVTDPQNWPVLIHCKVGLGRTGTMAALVRYAIDGWTMDEAIKEARVYRGGNDLVPSQLAWLRKWEGKHAPACHRPISPTEAASQD